MHRAEVERAGPRLRTNSMHLLKRRTVSFPTRHVQEDMAHTVRYTVLQRLDPAEFRLGLWD